MNRIKAIFKAFRTLGRNPDTEISQAWGRIMLNVNPGKHGDADIRLIEDILRGVQEDAQAWSKKNGEQPQAETAGE